MAGAGRVQGHRSGVTAAQSPSQGLALANPSWPKDKDSPAPGNSAGLALHGAGMLGDRLRLWKVLSYKDSRTELKWSTRDRVWRWIS